MATAAGLSTFPFEPGGAAEDTPLCRGCVVLTDLTALPRFGLKGGGSAGWLAAHGISLPAVNRIGAHRGMRVLRLGGEDFLLLAEGAEATLAALRSAWLDAVGSKGYSSWREEGWAWMRLSGPALADAMQRLCALDLRPDRFADDEIAQTRVGGVEAVLQRAGGGFDMLFDVTAAAYVARTVAAVEKRCAILHNASGGQ